MFDQYSYKVKGYKVKGYKVSIWTEPHEGGFFGGFQCHSCPYTHTSNHLDKTEEIALNIAKNNAHIHITGTHKDKKEK